MKCGFSYATIFKMSPAYRIPFFARILCPFSIGIYLSQHSSFAKLNLPEINNQIFQILILLIIIFLLRTFKVLKNIYIKGFIVISVLLFQGFSWGIHRSELRDSEHFSRKNADHLLIRIDTEPEFKNGFFHFTASLKAFRENGKTQRANGQLWMRLYAQGNKLKSQISYGSICWIPAVYEQPSAPVNPAMFNRQQWLAGKQIFHTSTIRQEALWPGGQNDGNPVLRYALQVRKQLIRKYNRLLEKPSSIGLVSSLILGSRTELDQGLIMAYSKTGVIHILSVSGMHVGLIYWIFEFLLYPLGASHKGRILRFGIILVLLWIYVLITGYSSSVIRAALMLSLLMLSRITNRPSSYPDLIFLAAFGMLYYKPAWLWDIGFQLSFLAIAGIIYLYPLIFRTINFKGLLARKLWEFICISLAAQCFTTPLSMYYFHLFPVNFLISNLFITIPVTLIIYSGISLLILESQYLVRGIEFLTKFLNEGILQISNLPYPTLEKIWLNPMEVFLLYLLICIPILPFRIKTKCRYIGMLLIGLQAIGMQERTNTLSRRKIIHFEVAGKTLIAVNRADEIVIISTFIPSDLQFQYYLQPALDSMRITKIKLIHPDSQFRNAYMQLKKRQVIFRNQQIELPKNMGSN